MRPDSSSRSWSQSAPRGPSPSYLPAGGDTRLPYVIAPPPDDTGRQTPRWDWLEKVDWSPASHANGPAIEVPGLLRAIRSSDPQTRKDAYRRLTQVLVAQGPRHEASLAAVPSLIEVVADPDAPDRFAACQVLTVIAIGDERTWLTDPPDLPKLRRDVQHRADMTMEAYDAVRAGVTVYIAALEAPDPAVRLDAAHVLAWFPEERETIAPALARLLAGEPDPYPAAAACVAAGLCGVQDDQTLIDVVSARLDSRRRGERWSAVLGLARLLSRPDRFIIEELYTCLSEAIGPVPHWPFLNGDMSTMAALTLRDLGLDAVPDRVNPP